MNKSILSTLINRVLLGAALVTSPLALADPETNTEQKIETDAEQAVVEVLEKIEEKAEAKLDKKNKKKSKGRYKKITLSDDKTYYTIDGLEELGPNPVDGEDFFVKYKKSKYEGEADEVNFRIRDFNRRDGFYLAYSAVSTNGDNIHFPELNSEEQFDAHFSYRVQLVGLFVESPGLNSRRLHGLYATNAWGINFYNSEHWSLDIYKQTDTNTVEGLEGILTRNADKRAGVRATGYFDSSQLQFIYSPYSAGESEDHGIEASVSYTHYWQVRNWNFYGSIGAQYQSKEVVDFYQPDLATDQSRINSAAEIGFEYALNKDWVLGAFTTYNEMPSQSSTIDTVKSGNRSGLLLTFVF